MDPINRGLVPISERPMEGLQDQKQLSAHLQQIEKNKSFRIHSRIPSQMVVTPWDLPDDAAETYIRIAHSQYLRKSESQNKRVDKIDYVKNEVLQDAFNARRVELLRRGVYVEELLLFYGTSEENMQSIIRSNFDANDMKTSVYGTGFHFSEYPEDATRNGPCLILCKVVLGQVQENGRCYDPNSGCHSFKTIDPESSRDVPGSIYVIGERSHILPYCVIYPHNGTFPKLKIRVDAQVYADAKSECNPDDYFLKVHSWTPSQKFSADDPAQRHIRKAEKHFLKKSFFPNLKIERIDYIENDFLEDTFNARRNELRDQGVSVKERLLFHGTSRKNIQSITRFNFKSSRLKRSKYGPGFYFSQYPAIAALYGPCLILCKVLPGLVQKKGQVYDAATGCHSFKTMGSSANWFQKCVWKSEIHLIGDADHILPYCVIYTEKVTNEKSTPTINNQLQKPAVSAKKNPKSTSGTQKATMEKSESPKKASNETTNVPIGVSDEALKTNSEPIEMSEPQKNTTTSMSESRKNASTKAPLNMSKSQNSTNPKVQLEMSESQSTGSTNGTSLSESTRVASRIRSRLQALLSHLRLGKRGDKKK